MGKILYKAKRILKKESNGRQGGREEAIRSLSDLYFCAHFPLLSLFFQLEN